jgi:RNA-binding protein
MAQTLSAAQKRHLRALAHHLRPVILMGAKGPSDALLSELQLALERHELVKVKLAAAEREERDALIDTLTSATGAALVQRIGHVAVLFLRNAKQPLIVLPRAP